MLKVSPGKDENKLPESNISLNTFNKNIQVFS